MRNRSHSHYPLWLAIFLASNGCYDCRGTIGLVEKLEARVQQLEARDAPGPWRDCGHPVPALPAEKPPGSVQTLQP